MTTAAICATREASWRPSFYRGEQYDSDLALYYLRARYYDPLTERFLSIDPEDGISTDPGTLHKYLYAAGDPVNRFDPTGRANDRVAAPGGAAAEYGALIAVLFAVARVTANNATQHSTSIATSLHMIGESLSCSFHRTACMLSGLASKKGGRWGQGRCDLCYEACIRNEGIWPTDVRTTGRSLDCEYRLYPSE